MKCSECGGGVITLVHAVYRTDGGSSGTYSCQKCGRTKGWSVPGYKIEKTIDMSNCSHKTSSTTTAQNNKEETKTPDLHVKSTAQNGK